MSIGGAKRLVAEPVVKDAPRTPASAPTVALTDDLGAPLTLTLATRRPCETKDGPRLRTIESNHYEAGDVRPVGQRRTTFTCP